MGFFGVFLFGGFFDVFEGLGRSGSKGAPGRSQGPSDCETDICFAMSVVFQLCCTLHEKLCHSSLYDLFLYLRSLKRLQPVQNLRNLRMMRSGPAARAPRVARCRSALGARVRAATGRPRHWPPTCTRMWSAWYRPSASSWRSCTLLSRSSRRCASANQGGLLSVNCPIATRNKLERHSRQNGVSDWTI